MVALIELTQEERILVLAGYADEPGYRPFPSAKRMRAERDEEERARDEGRGPREDVPGAAFSLERLLLARHWRQHTIELALLTSGGRIMALARAAGGRRVPAGGFRRVTIGPWHPVQLRSSGTKSIGGYLHGTEPSSGRFEMERRVLSHQP